MAGMEWTQGNRVNQFNRFNLTAVCLERWATDAETASWPALSFVHADGSTVRYTYGEVWERVQRVAGGLLASGLVPGDRVLVRLPHAPEYAFAFFGAVLAGLLPIPSSPKLTGEEVAGLLEDSAARAMIGREGAGAGVMVLEPERLEGAELAGALPETGREDAAYLIYTSGTSSRPKGVRHAHRSILARQMMRDAWEGFRAGDTVMHAGTLNWSYTLGVGLMDTWMAGGHAVLYGGEHDPAVWPELLREHAVSVFAAVPTVYRQMLKYGMTGAQAFPALRHVLCAGESLLPSLLDAWRERAGTEMYEAFGMTEVSTYISTGPGMAIRPGSPGKPQPGRRVVILPREGDGTEPLPPGEVGLIAVHRSDPGLMLGYWQRPEEEAAAFRGEWFIGGDLAAMDGDGYIWYQGRADDVINAFGVRLSPVEIEAALGSCPGVTEVGVVGLPLEEGKVLVTACVVPSADGGADEARLRAHAQAHLAGYKQPHQYVMLEALPRTASGKLLRPALVQRLLERDGASRG